MKGEKLVKKSVCGWAVRGRAVEGAGRWREQGGGGSPARQPRPPNTREGLWGRVESLAGRCLPWGCRAQRDHLVQTKQPRADITWISCLDQCPPINRCGWCGGRKPSLFLTFALSQDPHPRRTVALPPPSGAALSTGPTG